MTIQAPTAEQVRDARDAIAPGFDEYVTPQTLRLGEDALGRIELRPGTRILDVAAAGGGAVAIPAARPAAARRHRPLGRRVETNEAQ